MDWFSLYFIGFIVCLGLLGLAVMSAVKHSRGAGGGHE